MLPYTSPQFLLRVFGGFLLSFLIFGGLLVSLVVFGFLGFVVFGQGGRCKGKSSIFGHFRKRSEAIGHFRNFRKQNLSESSEGPRSEPI